MRGGAPAAPGSGQAGGYGQLLRKPENGRLAWKCPFRWCRIQRETVVFFPVSLAIMLRVAERASPKKPNGIIYRCYVTYLPKLIIHTRGA